MKARNVVMLLVLALVCVGVFFLLPGGPGADDGDLLPAVMPQFAKADATVVTLRGKDAKLELRKRAGANDRWDVVEGVELVRADANAVDDLLAALSRQSVRDRIPAAEAASNIAEYGLDKPIVEVDITAAGGEIHLRYGKLSREAVHVYMDTGEGTDVWVVPKDATDFAVSAISGGLRSKRLFDSTAFDVAKLEIVKGGVTAVQVDKDLSQLWTMSQPFKGYPNPKAFETLLSDIVNSEVESWIEFGAPDLAKYGLAKPAYEVRITPRGEGKKTEVIQIGLDDERGAFVLEAGTKTVVRVGRRFVTAVFADPISYRDRSFTRLGRDGVAIEVRVGSVNYKLEKAGSTWDANVGSDRHPADGGKVQLLLDRLASWQSVEFLDAQKPGDLGVTEKDFVEITRQAAGREAPAKIVLFFNPDPAKRPDDKTVYAMRKDDGACERVESEPLDTLLKGAQQFFRSSVSELPIDAIDQVTRDSGFGEEGTKVQSFRIARDLRAATPTWDWDATGNTGKVDADAINTILAALRSVTTAEWIPFAAEKDNDRMGFRPPLSATLTITAHLANVAGMDPDPKIYVGKRRAEGGYFARLVGRDVGGNWAFVMPDEVAEALKVALSKD